MTGFFEWVLESIYSFIGSYGWSVVIFTLLIRFVLLPLDIKSRKSMRAMSRIQPKVQELQKKYAKDQEKLNKKMSELYKKEHVNPLSGCLPMLIQLPVLFIMFGAMRNIAAAETGKMLESLMTELAEKGAEGVDPWVTEGFLWIKNVFQPDSFGASILPSYETALNAIKAVNADFVPAEGLSAVYNAYLGLHYGGADAFMTIKVVLFNLTFPTNWTALTTYANGLFILPLFAGVSQLFTTKLTAAQQPAAPAANGQNPNAMNNGFMKWFFPLFSIYICATANAAFSIYWAASNIVMIVMQVCINKYFNMKDEQAAAQLSDNNDM